jgi:hypothetical protein
MVEHGRLFGEEKKDSDCASSARGDFRLEPTTSGPNPVLKRAAKRESGLHLIEISLLVAIAVGLSVAARNSLSSHVSKAFSAVDSQAIISLN